MFQMTFGAPAHVTWSSAQCNPREAIHQSVYRIRTSASAVALAVAIILSL